MSTSLIEIATSSEEPAYMLAGEAASRSHGPSLRGGHSGGPYRKWKTIQVGR